MQRKKKVIKYSVFRADWHSRMITVRTMAKKYGICERTIYRNAKVFGFGPKARGRVIIDMNA